MMKQTDDEKLNMTNTLDFDTTSEITAIEDAEVEAVYAAAISREVPDLWNRIEAGIRAQQRAAQQASSAAQAEVQSDVQQYLPFEIQQYEQPAMQQNVQQGAQYAQAEAQEQGEQLGEAQPVDMEAYRLKRARRKKMIGVLAAAAILLVIAIPTFIFSGSRREKKDASVDSMTSGMDKSEQNILSVNGGDDGLEDAAEAESYDEVYAEDTEAFYEEVEDAAVDSDDSDDKRGQDTAKETTEDDVTTEAAAQATTEATTEVQAVEDNIATLYRVGNDLYIKNITPGLVYVDFYLITESHKVKNPEVFDEYEIQAGKNYMVEIKLKDPFVEGDMVVEEIYMFRDEEGPTQQEIEQQEWEEQQKEQLEKEKQEQQQSTEQTTEQQKTEQQTTEQ